MQPHRILSRRIPLALISLAVLAACNRTPPKGPPVPQPPTPPAPGLDESAAYLAGPAGEHPPTADSPPDGIGFSQSVRIAWVLQRDTLRGGELVRGRRGWAIREGDFRLSVADDRPHDLEPELKVDQYEPSQDMVVCQLDVSAARPWCFAHRGFDKDRPITLVDEKGRVYPAIGFSYIDADQMAIRYTPGTPLKGSVDLPEPLDAAPGQQCKLIFRVRKGVVIAALAIGDKLAIKWRPMFKVDADQMPR